METAITVIIFVLLVSGIAVPYWVKVGRARRDASAKFEKNQRMGITAPVTLHPQFDLTSCIGCAACVRSCPEHVLGIVQGKPAIINGAKCVGHALCAEACPVGAITMGFGTPRQGMEIPYYGDNYETNVSGLYIVGELGGVGLIKNAVAQGTTAIEHAAKNRARGVDELDVVIVGAGPAGLAAALACHARNLRYVVLEQEEVGGTILHYPRQKLVLTQPVELPLYGKLKFSEITKENLLKIWLEIVGKFELHIKTGHKVESVDKANGLFVVKTKSETFRSANVLLALGRRGSPRKLGVPGENLPKVMYRLIEAETYKKKHLLVVGGGDSAVEAAVGLATQVGNVVTLSYRKAEFVRLKEKNEIRVKEYMDKGLIRAIFSSEVREIATDHVVVQEARNVMHNIPNEFVFVFAGGELPTELLKRSGVKLRTAEVERAEIAAAA